MATVEWTEKQQEFQAWLALPPDMREPGTQKELAALLEVSENALCEWKRKHGFLDAANALSHHALREHAPAVYANIIHHATTGKDRAWVDLYLSMIGRGGSVAGANASMQFDGAKLMSEEEAEAIFARAGINLSP